MHKNTKINILPKNTRFLNYEGLKAKLSFLVSIAAEIEPFLGKYQTDDPMVPFLRNDMHVLIIDLFTKIVRPSQMNNVKSITDILKIDLGDFGTSCFAPDIMLFENIVKQRADTLLSFLVDGNCLCAIKANRIKKEYSDFITKDNIKKQLIEFYLKKHSP